MGFLSAFQKQPLTDRAQSVDKFSGFLARFLERAAGDASPEDRSITLIARAPSMAAVRALLLHGKEIHRQDIAVRVIFARLAPVDMLGELSALLTRADTGRAPSGAMRFIKNAALLDAHEQLVLGRSLCWTGDMLRRSEEQRNRLDILEENQPSATRRGVIAFNALWNAAKPVHARALGGNMLHQAFASVDPAFAALGLPATPEATPMSMPGVSIFTRH
jgi:hypothetical protein